MLHGTLDDDIRTGPERIVYSVEQKTRTTKLERYMAKVLKDIS